MIEKNNPYFLARDFFETKIQKISSKKKEFSEKIKDSFKELKVLVSGNFSACSWLKSRIVRKAVNDSAGICNTVFQSKFGNKVPNEKINNTVYLNTAHEKIRPSPLTMPGIIVSKTFTSLIESKTFHQVKSAATNALGNINNSVQEITIFEKNKDKVSSDDNLSKEERIEKRKKITKEWSDEKGNIAFEELTRTDTVSSLKSVYESTINYLESLPEPDTIEQKEQRNIELLYAKEMLEKCNQTDSTWANSDYFRSLLRGNKDLDPKTHSLAERVEAYENIVKNEYMPFPGNMRYHQVTTPGRKQGVVRLGIMSYMGNGFTNLKELKKLQKNVNEGNEQPLNNLREEIKGLQATESKRGNKQVDVTAQHALNQISSKSAIDEAVAHRRRFLKYGFLLLLLEQAKNTNFAEFDKDYGMVHVALLNQKSKSFDSTGWYHNEENEMLDTAEIFSEFDQSKLICDGKGPYIDEEGNIHLPTKVENTQTGEAKELQLHTFFVNNSIQGSTKNTKTVRNVNLKAKASLERFLNKTNNQNKNVREGFDSILSRKTTSIATGAQFMQHGCDANLKVSVGCMSAKDRGGIVCAVWAVLGQMKAFSTKAKRRIMRAQLLEGSAAIDVVYENSRSHVMKLSVFHIPGVTDHVRGFLLRSAIFFKQGYEILKENKRISKQFASE